MKTAADGCSFHHGNMQKVAEAMAQAESWNGSVFPQDQPNVTGGLV